MTEKFAYTTGTYAVAATKAALTVLLEGRKPTEIETTLPTNKKALILVSYIEKLNDSVKCSVTKKSVEEADVTHNMEILSQVSFRNDDQIIIDGGKGIGRITKPGLQLSIGEAAINPVPRKMIKQAVRELTKRGVNIMVSAPKGDEIAAQTTNARLGIIGGISIIGTTGIMKPKSLSSFKQTIFKQLVFCEKNSFQEVIITPGNISEAAMQSLFRTKFEDHQLVQSGDHLGFTLKHAKKMNLSIILAGHPGKLAKVLSNNFQTHYTKSPAANKAVILFFKNKVDDFIIKKMEESPTVEGITGIIKEHGKQTLLDDLADVVEGKIKAFLNLKSTIPVLFFNMNKELVGRSTSGEKWISK